MDVKSRLKKFLQHENLGQKAFEEYCGLANGYVNNIRRSITPSKLQQIALHFPQLNTGWLLTGEGEMLKTQSNHTVVTGDVSGNGNQFVAGNNNHIGVAANPKPEDVEVLEAEDVELPLKETYILTPEIINQEGLDIQKELNEGTLEVQIKPTQDVLPPHEFKIYTENDEMAPDIEVNDPVFARPILTPALFKPRYMYFVDLDIGAVVRWVDWANEDKSLVRLISRKAIDVVPLASIKSMAEIVVITKRPKTLPLDIEPAERKFEKKEQQLNTLLEQQGELIGIIKEQISK